MLNRHNSMTSMHHPLMPFKWRPFDLYNDVHVSDLPLSHDANVCERLTSSSNCVQCCCGRGQCEHSDHHHHHVEQDHHQQQPSNVMMCDGNGIEQQTRRHHRHRQSSSRGSSSGSGESSASCASTSTIGRYFVNDIDNSESHMDSQKSCGSVDCFCCKLDGQRNLIADKMSNGAHHRYYNHNHHHYQHSDCSICYNEIAITKCCTPNCADRSSPPDRTTTKSTNTSVVNRAVVLPFDGIDFTYKYEQSMIDTVNHCENPSMPTERPSSPPTIPNLSANANESTDSTAFNRRMKISHCNNASYFDNNWMIVHKNRPHTYSSKYVIFVF